MHVAVQTGTKYEDYLKSLKAKFGFSLQGYPGDTDAVAQILLGRADAVLTQDTSAAYQIKQHPGKLQSRICSRSKDSFGIYFRKGDADGRAAQLGRLGVEENGTLAKLAAKYKLPASDVK